MPYVPEALPRVTPKALSKLTLRSFPRRVPRVPEYPRAGRALPDAPELATCPKCRNQDNIPSRCLPKEISVPECLNRQPPPGALRASHVSRDSPRENLDTSRMRHVPPSAQAHRNFPEAPECAASPASANLRKPPSAPREIFPRMISECDTCPEPQTVT